MRVLPNVQDARDALVVLVRVDRIAVLNNVPHVALDVVETAKDDVLHYAKVNVQDALVAVKIPVVISVLANVAMTAKMTVLEPVRELILK